MAIQDIRDALVIRERDLFLLTDVNGQVPRGDPNGYGLYYEDTRYLSAYEFSFATARPIVLLSTAQLGFSSEHVLTNPSMSDARGQKVPRGTIHIQRLRVMDDMLEETIRIINHNSFPVELELAFLLSADFADIFEVRGYKPSGRGQIHEPRWQNGAFVFGYKGRDARPRQTVVAFDPPPDDVRTEGDSALAFFRLPLHNQEGTTLALIVSTTGTTPVFARRRRFEKLSARFKEWLEGCTRIVSDNNLFNAVLERSLADLRMLWNYGDGGPAYPAAGTPWYDTLFGRDACITGLQTLAFRPDIARNCLASLARRQGSKFDSWRDEEPGKILHELRKGELTAIGELPFSPYYGSIDSTPLFLWLAGEYYRWSGDIGFLAEIETNLRNGLYWLEKHGDSNGDGYIDYEKRSERGLVNQGWKDSSDAMIHEDGSPMKPPISLVEVQGYAFAAMTTLAPVFLALGDRQTAYRLRRQAVALRRRFNSDFWLPRKKFYALALDGDGTPSASVTSNPGHGLWTGIVDQDKARHVVRRLMNDDMFSGWGIRTLSAESPRFNPLGYHLGTVWPHDNSAAAMGFKRYGFRQELNTLARSLYTAATSFPYYRLPELFGGSALSPYPTPVPYPVACRPQAWAAGSILLITQAILGLCADAPNDRLLVVSPALPEFVRTIEVRGLRVGRGEADLVYERRGSGTRVHVLATRGRLRVERARRWPRRPSEATDSPGANA
jgi:glycogen debranching enzyme